MSHQFLPQSEINTWQSREDLLSRMRKNATLLFGEEWHEDSVWELSKYLILQLQKYSKNNEVGIKQKSFFYAVAEQLDYSYVASVNKYLESLLKVIVVPASASGAIQPSVAITEEWNALGDFLDLNPEGAKKIWERVKGLPESELIKLTEEMRLLAMDYNDFRVIFMFVAATLIYFVPSTTITNLDDFKYFLSAEAEKKDKSFNIKSGLTTVNFLGWSLVNENKEVSQWSVEYLTKQFRMDSNVFDNSVDTLFFLIILHLAFFNFADQPKNTQEDLMKKFVWSALCLGVLVEDILKEVLLKMTMGDSQKEYAINLAENMTINSESIYSVPGKSPMMIGEFVKRFLTFSRGDHGGFMQVKYVEELSKENNWPEGLRYYLFILLNLYFHLKTGEILSAKKMII